MKITLHQTTFAAAAIALAVSSAHAKITLDLDYTYDANGFFSTGTANGLLARATLAKAADFYNDRMLDTYSAITPDASNTWTPNFPNPATGANQTLSSPTIAAGVIKVFAGGRSIPGSTLAIGGHGGFNASGFQPFFNSLRRGQSGDTGLAGATDYGIWGGAITFDTDAATTWNYNSTLSPTGSQIDMLSVAIHEFGHLMGFSSGSTDSFNTYVSGSNFVGAKATAANGGTSVPLGTPGHLAQTLTATVTGTGTQTVVMAPAISSGQRRLLTVLEYAVLDDLGWDLARPGDANASGTINFDDLVPLAQNYNASGPQISWSEGDFNYDGVVNFDDLVPLAQNYNTSGALLTSDQLAALGSSNFAADWALAQSIVPEPTSLAMALAAIPFAKRRQRR